ncbi:MAG: (Fe-S)-binding protein, partial [Promethearchaeota archaeon]
APAFSIREMDVARNLAKKNNELIKSTGAKIVVSDCPGCVETLTTRYKKEGFDLDLRIVHIVKYLNELIKEGKISFNEENATSIERITIHDPCHLARNQGDTTSIREIIKNIPGIEIVESMHNKERVHCCGWSGTLHWADREIALKEASNRVEELKNTGAYTFLSACPLCELGLGYGIKAEDKGTLKVCDISELIFQYLL